MVEIAVALALVSATVTMALSYSLPALQRNELSEALYDTQLCFQRARMEAVSRNHECRCVVDTAERRLLIVDTLGTSSLSDDQILLERRLGTKTTFARPDLGSPITLSQAGSRYFATFAQSGEVTAGSGSVSYFAGNRFARINLYAAGGTEVLRWSGSRWEAGP